MNRSKQRRSTRARLAARIAMLEEHQAGRRAYIQEAENLIARRQIEIDNLRNQLDPPPSQRAVQLWGCDDDQDAASCE